MKIDPEDSSRVADKVKHFIKISTAEPEQNKLSPRPNIPGNLDSNLDLENPGLAVKRHLGIFNTISKIVARVQKKKPSEFKFVPKSQQSHLNLDDKAPDLDQL